VGYGLFGIKVVTNTVAWQTTIPRRVFFEEPLSCCLQFHPSVSLSASLSLHSAAQRVDGRALLSSQRDSSLVARMATRINPRNCER
jgi:hypothetical protein